MVVGTTLTAIRAPKRRRLSSPPTPPPEYSLRVLAKANGTSPMAHKPEAQLLQPRSHACSTCYRSLNGLHNAPVICARCSSTICTVCSRTCTSCAPSQPPTPHLTWSPTPTLSPTLLSPRKVVSLNGRGGLGHSSRRAGDSESWRTGAGVEVSMAGMGEGSPILADPLAGQRRKFRDEEGAALSACSGSVKGTRGVLQDRNGYASAFVSTLQTAYGKEQNEEEWGSGCGRAVCRNCCIENVQSGSTTCYDCYGQ